MKKQRLRFIRYYISYHRARINDMVAFAVLLAAAALGIALLVILPLPHVGITKHAVRTPGAPTDQAPAPAQHHYAFGIVHED